ncbi:MAG TPA: CmcJ/NvfI family oxidoreductase [Acetobacteraceae bacterium]|nr:CmcJ/NvfI family oxidoreductase [Acetobacteraceae bacterium]
MALGDETIRALPFVEGALTYLAPMQERARTLAYDPGPGVPRTNMRYETHRVPVRDMRPIRDAVSLDGEGFALVEHRSEVRDFYDEDELRRVYYPETERVVAAATGAARVVVFDHTIRRRTPGVEDRTPGIPRQPASRIHGDYTEKSGPQRVRDIMGEEAETLLRRRFAIVNLWRPIRGPLRDMPLALCEAGSVAPEDWAEQDLVYRDRTGEIYALKYNPRHRWFYAPAMRADEALLLKCYDSARDGRARFMPHTAFEDPATPPDAPPRESIELRTLAFFDA